MIPQIMLQVVQNQTIWDQITHENKNILSGFGFYKKCVEAVFYFFTAVENHNYLNFPADRVNLFHAFPAEQIFKHVSPDVSIINFVENTVTLMVVHFAIVKKSFCAILPLQNISLVFNFAISAKIRNESLNKYQLFIVNVIFIKNVIETLIL